MKSFIRALGFNRASAVDFFQSAEHVLSSQSLQPAHVDFKTQLTMPVIFSCGLMGHLMCLTTWMTTYYDPTVFPWFWAVATTSEQIILTKLTLLANSHHKCGEVGQWSRNFSVTFTNCWDLTIIQYKIIYIYTYVLCIYIYTVLLLLLLSLLYSTVYIHDSYYQSLGFTNHIQFSE